MIYLFNSKNKNLGSTHRIFHSIMRKLKIMLRTGFPWHGPCYHEIIIREWEGSIHVPLILYPLPQHLPLIKTCPARGPRQCISLRGVGWPPYCLWCWLGGRCVKDAVVFRSTGRAGGGVVAMSCTECGVVAEVAGGGWSDLGCAAVWSAGLPCRVPEKQLGGFAINNLHVKTKK